MRRLTLAGLKTDKHKILDTLLKSGCFQPIANDGSVEFAAPVDRTHLEKALVRQAVVANAISILENALSEYTQLVKDNEKAVKKGKAEPLPARTVPTPKKSAGRLFVGYDDFYDVAAKEYELRAACDEIEVLGLKRPDIRARKQRAEAEIKQLLPYANLPVAFSQLGEGKTVTLLAAHAPTAAALPSFDFPFFSESYPAVQGTTVAVLCKNEDYARAAGLLVGAGFSICPYTQDERAGDKIEKLQAEIAACEEEDFATLGAILDYAKYLPELQMLYDVIGQDVEKSSADLDFLHTADTFVADGWVPEKCSGRVLKSLSQVTEKVVYTLREPKEDEVPPTLVESKKIIRPYEGITNMYSLPAYNEIDPNPFMAVFFFIFFGMMIGDAGYGVVLAIGCGLILHFLKFEKGTAQLIALMGMGGVSAIVWGLLFGGVFSIDKVPPLWFNPIDEPLMMLGVSIALGAVQLLCGYALHSARLFKDGKPLDAIFDSIFIFILFGAIVCFALGLLLKTTAPLKTVGLVLLIVSLVGILLTAGRHRKGILSKFLGGFSGLYGLVNLLSDLLSYARIFGLGLASGAIGMAFNTLGSMFFGTIPGYIIGFIVLIPLHAFNLGIGLLGAYVHNARLQFLEFYGKFYDGGGIPFAPLGENTKFVRFR